MCARTPGRYSHHPVADHEHQLSPQARLEAGPPWSVNFECARAARPAGDASTCYVRVRVVAGKRFNASSDWCASTDTRAPEGRAAAHPPVCQFARRLRCWNHDQPGIRGGMHEHLARSALVAELAPSPQPAPACSAGRPRPSPRASRAGRLLARPVLLRSTSHTRLSMACWGGLQDNRLVLL